MHAADRQVDRSIDQQFELYYYLWTSAYLRLGELELLLHRGVRHTTFIAAEVAIQKLWLDFA